MGQDPKEEVGQALPEQAPVEATGGQPSEAPEGQGLMIPEGQEVATVIEPSKDLEIAFSEKATIITNIEGVEAYLMAIAKPFVEGTVDVSTKELETEARKVLAAFKKEIEAVDKQRIAKIKAVSYPITEADKRLKGMVAKALEAYDKSMKALKDKVEAWRKDRRAELVEIYKGTVGEKIAKSVPYEKIEDKSWDAPSYGAKKAEDELFERAKGVVDDMKVLADQELAWPDEVLAHYCEHVDLRAALAHDKELTRQKEEAAAKAEAARTAFKVQPRTAPKPAPGPMPVQEPMQEHPAPPKDAPGDGAAAPEAPGEGKADYVIILRGVTLDEAKEIARFAADLTDTRPELNGQGWMKEKGL